MTIRGFRQGGAAHLAAVVTAALMVAGTPAAWAGPAVSVKPATALSVQSEPAGAAVYVDGQLQGATPVAVEGVVSGDHTVRIVKEGFLENSRVVSVSAAGRSLHVTLTPTRIQPRASTMMQVEPGEPAESGGGGGKKWIFIGLGAAVLGGGGFLAYKLLTANDAPTISSVNASPSLALQGATAVAFSVSASDKNDDSLTYSWNFGDGATGTGASVTHTYPAPGPFGATVKVSDGKKDVTGNTNVEVRGLAGAWSGRFANGYPFTVNLAHSGSSLSGNYAAGYGSGPLTGSVASPLVVRFVVTVPGYYPFSFNGVADSGINVISGTASDPGGSAAFTLTRR